MFGLAYAITHAGEEGLNDPAPLGALVSALALGGVFVTLQARRESPTLPLALFGDRNRAGSYATMLFVGAGLMGTFYQLMLYLQDVLRFSPVRTGLSSLPFSVGIVLGSVIGSKMVERYTPRTVAAPGLGVAAAGMYWLSTLTVDASYGAHIVPGVFFTSSGLGMTVIALTLTAVHGVGEERAGVASALVNMAPQIGAALGLAAFTSISLTAANDHLPGACAVLRESLSTSDPERLARASEALTHGYTTAFLTGAAVLLIAAMVVVAMITTARTQDAFEARAGTGDA